MDLDHGPIPAECQGTVQLLPVATIGSWYFVAAVLLVRQRSLGVDPPPYLWGGSFCLQVRRLDPLIWADGKEERLWTPETSS